MNGLALDGLECSIQAVQLRARGQHTFQKVALTMCGSEQDIGPNESGTAKHRTSREGHKWINIGWGYTPTHNTCFYELSFGSAICRCQVIHVATVAAFETNAASEALTCRQRNND